MCLYANSFKTRQLLAEWPEDTSKCFFKVVRNYANSLRSVYMGNHEYLPGWNSWNGSFILFKKYQEELSVGYSVVTKALHACLDQHSAKLIVEHDFVNPNIAIVPVYVEKQDFICLGYSYIFDVVSVACTRFWLPHEKYVAAINRNREAPLCV